MKMTYKDQLNSIQWKEKRNQILMRDNNRCTHCSNLSYINNFDNSEAIQLNEKGDFYIYSISKNTKRVLINKNLNPYNRRVIISFKDKAENNYLNLIAVREYTKLDDYLVIKRALEDLKPEKASEEFKNALLYLANINIEEYKNYAKLNNQGIVEKFNWIYLKDIHIHHKYYQKNKFAWEYPDDALTTLCWHCHEIVHKDHQIEVRDKDGKYVEHRKACNRCKGAGWIPDYTHVENGICFRCNGERFE